MKVLCLMAVVTSLLTYSERPATTYRVDIKPQAGEAFARAEYTLWIPEGVSQIQRIILHQHGCGDNAQTAGQTVTDDPHWRLLAQHTQSALLGSSLWPQGECDDWCDPTQGTERAFLQALDELAQRSGHPEVATVNWVVWGHSGGGYWTYAMLDKYPERFDAAVFQSPAFRLGGQRDTELQNASYHPNVPLLIHLGSEEKGDERFGSLYDDGVKTFALMREQGAPVTLAIDPASGHGSGNARYLTIPWIVAALASNEQEATTRPSEYSTQGNWFPDQVTAAKGEVFAKLGNVPDFTPPEQAPSTLEATASSEGVSLTWNATPDWESGVKTFRVYRNGKLLPPYTAASRQEGESTEYYRKPMYSDTPLRPLATMEYLDKSAQPDSTYRYQVSLVNWAGLQSPLSEPVEITFP